MALHRLLGMEVGTMYIIRTRKKTTFVKVGTMYIVRSRKKTTFVYTVLEGESRLFKSPKEGGWCMFMFCMNG